MSSPLLEFFGDATGQGGVFIDLGANFGNHTVFFAAVLKANLVIAVEPQPLLVEIIRRTVALNGLNNVQIYQAAVGAEKGFATLVKSYAENSGMATFAPTMESGDVLVVRMDDLVPDRRVAGIKVDVEGMQMPALNGLLRTIHRDTPPIWLELRPKEREVEAASEFLAALGYERRQISFRDFLFTVPQPI